MRFVERHVIDRDDYRWKRLDELSFLSKNLYNAALYQVKQEFINSNTWIRGYDLDKHYKQILINDYRAMCANVSQSVLLQLDSNISMFFKSMKAWKKDPKKFSSIPKFPKYKDKIYGRNMLVFTKNSAHHKGEYIKFSKQVDIPTLKTNVKFNEFKFVRILPQSSCYVIEVVYEKHSDLIIEKNNNWMSIDIGVNNLATCITNLEKNPIIINGKPIKSINQFYNKKISKLQI